MSLGIIIQARLGSTRLKNKILYNLGEKTVLEHVIQKTKKIKFKKKIILATSKSKKNKFLKTFSDQYNCYFFRGSEKNVLNRFYEAAKKYKIKTIVRICSDSPFIDHKIIEKAIEIFKRKKKDYVSNIIKPSYPAGMSVEVFNFKALKKANFSKTTKTEEEHVTPFFYNNTKVFKCLNFSLRKNYSHIKLSLDYKEDMIMLNKIYKKIGQKPFKKIINFLEKNKDICKINNTKKSILRY